MILLATFGKHVDESSYSPRKCKIYPNSYINYSFIMLDMIINIYTINVDKMDI